MAQRAQGALQLQQLGEFPLLDGKGYSGVVPEGEALGRAFHLVVELHLRAAELDLGGRLLAQHPHAAFESVAEALVRGRVGEQHAGVEPVLLLGEELLAAGRTPRVVQDSVDFAVELPGRADAVGPLEAGPPHEVALFGEAFALATEFAHERRFAQFVGQDRRIGGRLGRCRRGCNGEPRHQQKQG